MLLSIRQFAVFASSMKFENNNLIIVGDSSVQASHLQVEKFEKCFCELGEDNSESIDI